MNKKGPIILVDDDKDDQEVFRSILRDLDYPNEVICLQDASTVLDYLHERSIYPFMVVCDIAMPKINGFELRAMVQKDEILSHKNFPFILMSTHVSKDYISRAYQIAIQGVFVKPASVDELRKTFRTMIEYWSLCCSPSD